VSQGTNVFFNGSNSLSTGQNPVYSWSFLDGTQKTLTGITANYTFNNPGNYTVTLTVQDSLGSGNGTVLIIVMDTTPPVAVIAYQNSPVSQSITVGVKQLISLDGSQSYDPENSTIVRYEWQQDDSVIGNEQIENLTIASSGTHTISLTVFNSANLNNTATITVNAGQNQNQNSNNSQNNNSNNTNSSNTNNQNSNGNTSTQESFNLPPTILGVLIGVTISILVGAGFWLQKRT
jgi:PKD repeat protein